MSQAANGRSMKVLMFALDACEWSLVERWSREGHLPNFARLMQEGTRGTLTTTAAQLPDTVWSCIYGGRNPGTFSKYFYVQYDPRTGDLRHSKDAEFTRRPFWDVLADAGRKVGVVDAVKIPVSDKASFMVANWGAHATKAKRASVPEGLLPDLDRRFGRNPVGDVDRISDTAASRRDMRERILRGIELRRQVLTALVTEQDWDVFVAGFSELHQAGHHYWHGIDTTHPKHAEIVAQGLQDTVFEVYQRVDATIGAVIDAAPADCVKLVCAGHGMGTIWHASWNLDEMLDHLGYGPRPARPIPQAAAGSEQPVTAKKNFWRTLKSVVPGWLQYSIKACLPQAMQDELLFKWYAGKRDWQGWRAHAVPNNDSCGAIRIALKGRDPHGSVDPADYDAILDDIQAALEELTDPVTGRSVVHSVTRLRDAFHGEFMHDKPDLTICWEQTFLWQAVHSPRFGTLKIDIQDSRTGSHSPRGFFLLAGPGIEAGQELQGHSIYDLAPTVLAAAGVEVPAEMEGTPILTPAPQPSA